MPASENRKATTATSRIRQQGVPASSRLQGHVTYQEGKGKKEFFRCEEFHYGKDKVCHELISNTRGSIDSHATRIHNDTSQYQRDQDKSKKFHCPVCFEVTRGFNCYEKHFRVHHKEHYTGGKPLRTHQVY